MTPQIKSGRREAGWVVFITVTSIVVWTMWEHSNGNDMSVWVGLLTLAWPTAMTAALGPHVLHHIRPPESGK